MNWSWRGIVWSLVLFCGVLFWRGTAFGESPFDQGNQFFRAGKFQEAEGAYKRQLKEGGETAAVHFNLGKVREALGDPGGAMLEWERALRLDPSHGPSAAALVANRLITGAKVPKNHWWGRVKPALARGQEGGIAAVGGWVMVISLLAAWLYGARLGACAGGIFGVALFALGLVWLRDSKEDALIAVVRERSVTARSAPANPGKTISDLQAGSRVKVVGESAGWARCVLPDGGVGWVPGNSIERIDLAK